MTRTVAEARQTRHLGRTTRARKRTRLRRFRPAAIVGNRPDVAVPYVNSEWDAHPVDYP